MTRGILAIPLASFFDCHPHMAPGAWLGAGFLFSYFIFMFKRNNNKIILRKKNLLS